MQNRNKQTSGEQIFGYQYRKEEKSDSLPLKGLRPLLMSVYHSFRSPDDVTFQMASEQQSNGTPFRGMGINYLLYAKSK
jgi:hypothetical protein